MKKPSRIKLNRSQEMLALLSEQWMIKRLGQYGQSINTGLTTADERQERMRQAIRAVGPLVIVGRGEDGRGMTYERAFEKLYGELL